jgi:predicted secreted hydrolase
MLKSGILTFPDDEGRHEDANTEWWYFNGHVEAEDGNRYAFMVSYTMNNIKYLIIVDIDNQKHLSMVDNKYEVNYSKDKINLEYGDNWWKPLGKPFTYEMHNQYSETSLDLHLASLKPPLILGEGRQGKVPMGRGGYSYWYALTNLNIQGELKLGNKKKFIKGKGWMDRQWGNWNWFGFGKWKWFSIQLDNNIEFEVFKIYEPITNRALTSKFHIVHEDGTSEVFDNFKVVDFGHWRSPLTGETYSIGWKIKASEPKLDIELLVKPYFKEQEMAKGFWEGSCKVTGIMDGKRVSGLSFVELFNGTQASIPIKAICYVRAALRSVF